MTKELKCPRTNTRLMPVKAGGVQVYVSEGCGGIWLDQDALDHFKFGDARAADALTEFAESHSRPVENPEQRLRSPEAPDVVMMRRYYSPLRKIEIDECPATGGIWLDPGELCGIRNKFPSREEYERVGKQYVDEVMNSTEVKALKEESQAAVEKVQKVADFLAGSFLFGSR